MPAEIELKLTLDPAALKAFRRSTVLSGVRPSRQQVLNTYFDTPDCLLAQAQMALRLRRMGRRWLQTLKTAGSGAGGLSARGEWEFVLPDGVLDLALFRDTPLAALKAAPRLHELLQPAFTTDFQRTRWVIEREPGQRVEVALDFGEVRCADRALPICEVELELLAGEPATLIALAQELSTTLPLMPSGASKAERGYRLFRDEPLAPVRARPVHLSPDATPAQALCASVSAGLAHFLANQEGALATDDPEFIHQLRVALRRLRAVLRLFRADVGTDVPFADLRWLAAELGEARDRDVFCAEVWPPLAAAFVSFGGSEAELAPVAARADAAREAARIRARAALRSPRTARFILALAGLVSASAAPAADASVHPVGVDTRLQPLREFAARQIRRRHKRLLRDARNLAGMTADLRHRLRIDAKKLRYTAECFATLYRRERFDPWLAALTAIQAVLGEANDAATALRLLAQLEPGPTLHHFAHGWFAAKALAHADEVTLRFAELAKKQHRFWRAQR